MLEDLRQREPHSFNDIERWVLRYFTIVLEESVDGEYCRLNAVLVGEVLKWNQEFVGNRVGKEVATLKAQILRG